MSLVSEPQPGQGPLEAVAFASANSRSYLSAVFAAYRAGELVLALPRAPAIRNVPGVSIMDRRDFGADPGWFDQSLEPIHSEDPAQISFSSGTTGRPKALLLSHRALGDVVERINLAMGVDETIREYIGVPVTFSFGFGRVRAVAAVGGRSFLPEHGFDPSEIARMLRADEINAVSAVPTLWRIVLANPEIIGEAGRKLRWIEIGSQFMAGTEKAALRRLFPNARIVQHYGLTEASRTALLDVSEAPESCLDSVGRATGEVEIAISSEGLIRTRGPHLATGLVTGAGVTPVVDSDGWLTTSDRGRLKDGWLFHEGRMDELINSGGLKIDPTQFEQRLVERLGAPDDIAVGRAEDSLRGERVLVAIRQDSAIDRREVERAALDIARDFGLEGRGALSFREVAEIPRTATGKVRRAALNDLPDITKSAVKDQEPVPQARATDKAAALQALWAEILSVEHVSLHDSFYDLGGDSLSALTAIMRMEALGLDAEIARGIFDGKTIAEITGLQNTATEHPAARAAVPTPPASRPSGAISENAAALQTLWAEILGVETVSLHDSFYDLGGDSLSALTAIMRMEALGLDAEIARGIFDGKTIAEITGLQDTVTGQPTAEAVAAEPPAPRSSTVVSDKAAALQALWAEILGVEHVSLHDSFYDLGGDSLSALTAIMRMETLGLDPETARGIFDGKTIADLVGAPEGLQPTIGDGPEPSPAKAAQSRPETLSTGAGTALAPLGLTLAETMNAVHATRGLLILWVVVVHWLPGVLKRIGAPMDVYEWLTPALRFGTPGFAMVFGLGVGALGISHYRSNRELFLKGMRFNTKLIVGGVLLLALFRAGVLVTEGRFGDWITPSAMFYSAVSYYALAMLAMPLLMRVMTVGPNTFLTLLACSLGATVLHEIFHAAFAHMRPNGILELMKILFTAKYGFFRMTGYVMLGAAIGWFLRQHHRDPALPRDAVLTGLILIGFGGLGLYYAAPDDVLASFGAPKPWHMSIYAGMVLLLAAGFCVMNRAGGRHPHWTMRRFNTFAIVSGILALPIFVGHELVIPAKDLLGAAGLPGTLSLGVPLLIFLGGTGYLYVKLMRLLAR